MTTVHCALCLCEFEPTTLEHVLPNALGWRRASRDKICPRCNSNSSNYDADLAEAVSFLTLLIAPSGRRDEPPAFRPEFATAPLRILPKGEMQLPNMYLVDAEKQIFAIASEAIEDVRVKVTQRGRELRFIERRDATYEKFAVRPVRVTGRALTAMSKSALHFAALVLG